MDIRSRESDLVEGESLRANLYSLLASLLAGAPSEAILSRLRRIEDQPNAPGPMAVAWRQLKAAADQAAASELEDEYRALFVGLGRGELVPYASWYQTGRIMAEPLAQLRTDLVELGVQRQSGVFEAEDHASPLCETMALICSRQKTITIETQQRFFNSNIGGWMPQFFQDMQQASSARFYRAVGTLGEAFLILEKQYLNL